MQERLQDFELTLQASGVACVCGTWVIFQRGTFPTQLPCLFESKSDFACVEAADICDNMPWTPRQKATRAAGVHAIVLLASIPGHLPRPADICGAAASWRGVAPNESRSERIVATSCAVDGISTPSGASVRAVSPTRLACGHITPFG